MTGRIGAFDALYEQSDDPWGYRTRWYERRKRTLLLACLARDHYGRALEVGCSNGELTAPLAERTDTLVACDGAALGLASARLRVGNSRKVTFIECELPEAWPEGTFDLVVLSEIAYYFDRQERAALFAHLAASLAETAELITCHWRHPIDGRPESGDAVHGALAVWAAATGLTRLVQHVEKDFLLESWTKSALSVAQSEGIC